jgi:hypothetical protein
MSRRHRIRARSTSFFGTILGLTQAKISATAVAGGQSKDSQGATFAYDDGGTGCGKGITLATNNMTITAGIQSNGFLTISGNGGSFKTATYGPNCPHNVNGSVTASPAAPTAWPIDYSLNPPTCTENHTGNYTYSTAASVPGTSGTTAGSVVICATGTLTVNAGMSQTTLCGLPSQTTCPGITFKAPQIIVSSSSAALSAPLVNGSYGLLFYASGADPAQCTYALEMAANGDTLNGSLFAPLGTVQVSGNATGTGFIEGDNVFFGGNNNGGGCNGGSGNTFAIIGDGPPVVSQGSYALSQ